MTIDYFVVSIIVILLPGTGVLYTLAVGLGRGFRCSVYAAFGCTLGIVPAATASIVGLSAVLHASALGFQVLKVLGVAYLFYMAWSILREGGTLDVQEQNSESGSVLSIIASGFLLNVLNPKLSLFFLAFLPQFVPANSVAQTTALIILALIFMLLTFIVFVVYGAFAASARDYVISRPGVMRWLRRAFAATFGFLGIRLALFDS